MCGASDQQKQIEGQTLSFSQLLSGNYAANYGAQSAILKNIGNILTPIAQAGPDQQGYGANELAALNTGAGETVGADYAKASQQLNNSLAARGGGSEVLPTGAEAALKGQLASAGANALSTKQTGITEANYEQGRQNWSNATAGLNALAQDYNPNAIAGEATQTASAAYGEAQQNAMQGFQQFTDIASGVSALAGAASQGATMGMNIDQFANTGQYGPKAG